MEKPIISSSPHIQSNQHIVKIMRDVAISLLFPLAAGVWVYGLRALILTVISTASAVLFEYLWNVINKKRNTIGDFSACVTGMLIALVLPVTVPLWIPVVGALFAIIIVKQLFGGLGHNFMNPALAARGFLMASWALMLTTFSNPGAALPLFSSAIPADAISSATPLALAKAGQGFGALKPLVIGNVAGCIGETSVIAILIGAVYLAIKKVVRLEGPILYILTAGFFTCLFGYNGSFDTPFLEQICSGGLMFGAFFMFTDYVTSPSTALGTTIAAVFCGFITALIRTKGGYPEGVTYAILLTNVISPLLDKYIIPRKYGRKEAAR